uniref:Calmodulin n=1 Tax=Globisporangium ultimum (strain ATCC 200006 / CBS 805.95 / DAOM BR144) TaxID=431595 RepID=K3WLF1_GLOUD
MGNLVSYGGQADSASPENHALGSSALTAAALMAAGKDKAYIQRLSPAELKKYTDGYRRICRADASPSPSPTASPGGNGRSSSVAALPPVPMAALPAKQRSGGVAASQVAVSNAPPAVALPSAIGANTGRLSKKVFRLKLLGAFTMIPHSLSDRLFEVLDTERTGELSCENVLSGIAWLKYGTYEEQVRLLFIIYDLDDAGLVSRDVMDRFMDVVYGRRRARSATTVAFLDRIFAGRTSLTIDEFKLIVRERDERGDALLLQWLSLLADKIGTDEDAKILELERSYNPAVIRQRIAEATLFSVNEVTTLERQFHRLFDTKSGTSNRIPCEQFINVLSARDFPKQLLERVSATTTTLPGAVLFDEFCAFVSHFCRGKIAARYQHLFSIYKDAATATISWAAVNELFALGAHYATTEMDGGEMTRQIEGERLQLDKMIANSSGSDVEGWSEEAFVEWASSATAVQQLLHQLAFAACILFGIKPEAPSLERRIVEWHWKQVTQSIVVGQVDYGISLVQSGGNIGASTLG